MELDMYLVAKVSLSNYDHVTGAEKEKVQKILELFPEIGDGKDSTHTIEFNIGYWRKANHIHKWFVDNVQHGEDDCEEYSVDFDTIKELRDVCADALEFLDTLEKKYDKKHPTYYEFVIKDGDVIKLPTQSGFFFGRIKYDKWYYEDIKYTITVCDKALELSNPLFGKTNGYYYSIYYQSSW